MSYYKKGDYNAICDICGWKYKRSQLRYNSDGQLVCDRDWEPEHPLELIRTIPDNPSVPDSRVEKTDTFVTLTCTTETRSGVADYGAADCALADVSLL